MKILFIVPYPINIAPSQRLKFEQYFHYFEKAGIKCIVRPFMSKAFYNIVYKKNMLSKKIFYTLAGYIKRIFNFLDLLACDLVYIHLEATPFGPPFFEFMARVLNKPIIYDVDDIMFLAHYSETNRFKKYLYNPKKFFTLFKISSHVLVVTKYLKDCILKYNKNVTLIPPTVDTDRYILREFNKSKKICLGWSGSYTTSKYLYILENVLKKIKSKYDVKIKVVGNKDFKINGLDIDSQDWRLESEIKDLSEIDIGLYPLPKNEWALGKGGGKVFQYMSMGIPPVCTCFGEVLEFIEDGKNGFLADSEEEWLEKISRLIEDAKLRKKMGLAGRQTVVERYSVKAYANKYLELIRSTYSGTNSNRQR